MFNYFFVNKNLIGLIIYAEYSVRRNLVYTRVLHAALWFHLLCICTAGD